MAIVDFIVLVEELKASRLPEPQERRRLRLAAGLSLREAAASLGVNPMSVLRWEAGRMPRRGNALRYRRFLDALHEAIE